ncbi:MAG: protoheme IX farnesyltransferase [candidate division Zixibacteria bacterium]|nr:protoheme IX farnesyltransferase [candidate division Zixibacteria bacterium]
MKKNINRNRLSKLLMGKISCYWQLIKSYQTGLLLLTGVTGFISARCPVLNWHDLFKLGASLFLAISGSTILNMIYDRDIDAKMDRTSHRPLPSGKVNPWEALILGLIISLLGLGLAFSMSLVYGLIIFAGLFIDVVVYTIWLKRRTAWSIIWGGIAGGMPILAGRVLGTGEMDLIGGLLSLAILLWIPTHILTFNIRYFNDYAKAGIPTIPSVYGYKNTRLMVAISAFGAAIAIVIGAFSLGLSWGYMRLLVVLSSGILGLALTSIFRPSEEINFALFKYASLYMLGAMLIVTLEVML